MANKEKQNLRYAKTCQKLNKKRYKGLTAEQKAYIKAKEAFEQSEKALSAFWRTAPRSSTGAVNWDKMTELELDYFDEIHKKHEKNLKTMSKLEDNGLDVDYALNLFREINCNSVCF